VTFLSPKYHILLYFTSPRPDYQYKNTDDKKIVTNFFLIYIWALHGKVFASRLAYECDHLLEFHREA
jgi:hypothetical protein